MRGSDERTGSLFSFVDLEDRVPARHPLRKIRQIVNDALATLDGEFSRLYASEGRPSIAPEKLLRASLLQAFYSIRSERQLMEQLDYNLLFRWFVGLGVDDPVWVPTVFTKNRDRLLDADVAAKFMAAVLAHREVKPLLSNDHFSVDGTLVEAWASLKSLRHASYAASQRKRKLIEEAFGWAKTIAGLAKVKVRGLERVRHQFTFAMAAYNLIRMPKLLGWAAV